MSERQAKRQKKSIPAQNVKHTANNRSSIGFNVILAIIVAIVLALGAYAVVKQYQETHPSTDPETVADRAKTEGITVEEFLTKYGLDGNEEITADTELATASGSMSVANYAALEGTTVDDIKAQNGFTEEVTDDMTMEEASGYIPVGTMAEMYGMDYASFIGMYGLTEEQVPSDMLIKDANPILTEASEAMMAQQAETETDAAAEAEDTGSEAE